MIQSHSKWLFLIPLMMVLNSCKTQDANEGQNRDGREEIVFWHFWGGKDGEVVDDVVKRFNESQDRYFVRAIAMPGNNLDTKLFLSVAGGDPPDLVNQDDPIVADWAYRGIIEPFDQFVDSETLSAANQALLPSARSLGQFEGKTYAIANGLDIRALLYNKTFLDKRNLEVPKSLSEFDQLCLTLSPAGDQRREYYAYLPDSRRLWTWSYVFGGNLFDSESGRLQFAEDQTLAAAQWMQGFSRRYGADNLAAFRQGDQSLPGKTFPLLPVDDQAMQGRYIFILAGQWNTRDVVQFQQARKQKGIPYPEFGVTALPAPETGRTNAGWVNGNVFVVPKGAKCRQGAWEFVQFWIGLENPKEAANTCVEGGWIPVTQQVIDSESFQAYLKEHPLFSRYVELAASENQFPYPMVPAAPYLVRTLNATNEKLMSQPEADVSQTLGNAQRKIQKQLDKVREQYR